MESPAKLKIKKYLKTKQWSITEEEVKKFTRNNKLNYDAFSTLIAEQIMTLNLGFPYWSTILQKSTEELFRNLVKYKEQPVVEEYKTLGRYNEHFLTDVVPKNLDGEELILKTYQEDYWNINILSDLYSEPQRVKCKRLHKKYSPQESWDDYRELKKIILTTLFNYKSISREKIRESIFKTTSECTNFRLTTAKAFYQYFDANRILDFCAGWGDRLLASIAWSKNNKNFGYYHGVDPNVNMVPTYEKMIKDFGNEKQFKVIISPFEDVELKDTYDLVLTSPPYWNLEDFTHSDADKKNIEDQSSERYKDLDSWIVNFLLESLLKSFKSLEKNGHMIINMGDLMGKSNVTQYVEATILAFNALEKTASFLGIIAVSASNLVPFYVWKKTGVDNVKEREKNFKNLAKYYPTIIEKIVERYRDE